MVRATSATSLEMQWSLGAIHAKPEKLRVGGDYPKTALAEHLFHSFGLLQIVAPLLPSVIKTDFPVLEIAKSLTEAMYLCEGRQAPDWHVPGFEQQTGQGVAAPGSKAVVTYSGGKDSMWNLMHTRDEGYEPLAVHIRGLNQSVARSEHKDVLKQQALMQFPLAVVDLENSSLQKGRLIVRSRDVFLTALAVPLALEYGADKIYLEGAVAPDTPGTQFCLRASTWETYNELLKQAGLPVQMVGTDRGEIDSIRDLLEQHPDWMPLVSNCFTMTGLRESVAGKFLEAAPSSRNRQPKFPLYDSQCARCLKCRTVNLTRVLYDPIMQNPELRPDIAFFLQDTTKWLKGKRREIADIMDPGFDDLLAQAYAHLEV